MKVYEENGKYFMDDNGTVVEIFDKRNDGWLWLPTNSCGRTYVSLNKLAKKGGEIDYGDEVKMPRTISVTGERAPRKPREEWLDGDDLAEYRRLNALIDERIAAAKRKPMTALEKAQAKLEKAKAQLEALRAAQQD